MTRQVFRIGSGGMVPVQPADLEIGQVIFLNGYGQTEHHHERLAIFQKDYPDQGRIMYGCVNLDKPGFRRIDSYEITNVKDKMGDTIGMYYKEGDLVSQEEINQGITRAKAAEEEARIEKEEKQRENEKIMEAGKKLIEDNRMPGAVGFITASYMVDDTDLMTDYFGSHSERTVILAWTQKKREDFREMRNACLNCTIPEVRDLAETGEEHRENYSGGEGYFLGNKRAGWKVEKHVFSRSFPVEKFYLSAGRPEGFFAFTSSRNTTRPGNDQIAATAFPCNQEGINLTYVDYSEKAFAITGDTKPVKDQLKALGGRFNFRLTCGPGWIFPKTKEQAVRDALGIPSGVPEPTTAPADWQAYSFQDKLKDFNEALPEWVKPFEAMEARDYCLDDCKCYADVVQLAKDAASECASDMAAQKAYQGHR